MKNTCFVLIAVQLLFGCNSKGDESFSTSGDVPGTELTVTISKAVLRQGEQCSIPFTIKNVTNVLVKVPIDAWGWYSVKANGFDCIYGSAFGLYGRSFQMPDWYYHNLEPGASVTNTFTVLTGPRPKLPSEVLTNNSFQIVEAPFTLRIVKPGIGKLVVFHSTNEVGMLTLRVSE